jgi:ferredoxin
MKLAFVITSPCEQEKAAECLDVCPVDCIEIGEDQYFINPDICIDCGACQAVCPVDAIVEEYDMTPEQIPYLKKAEDFFGIS